MTDEPTTTDPWPVPDGSLFPEESLGRVWSMAVDAGATEADVEAFLANSPVKAHEDHPVYVHDLAILVDAFESIIDRLKLIQAEVASKLAQAIPYGTSLVAYRDTRPLTPRWGGQRKEWANDLLQADVKPRVTHDPESGEARSPEDVMEVAFSVVSLNGSNVKVTGLRALGLDPDDYCHKEPKPPTVQVTKDLER